MLLDNGAVEPHLKLPGGCSGHPEVLSRAEGEGGLKCFLFPPSTPGHHVDTRLRRAGACCVLKSIPANSHRPPPLCCSHEKDARQTYCVWKNVLRLLGHWVPQGTCVHRRQHTPRARTNLNTPLVLFVMTSPMTKTREQREQRKEQGHLTAYDGRLRTEGSQLKVCQNS